MQQLIIALGTTETKVFDSAGAYFEIIDSTGAISVNFYDRNGSRTKDLELNAVLSGTYVSGPFVRFEITNTYGVAQNVTILYGAGNGGSRRSPGTVRVIDQSRDLTNAGSQYLALCPVAANAGLFSIAGLRAVTKNVYIKRLQIMASLAGQVSMWACNGDPTNNAANYANATAPKLVGQALGVTRGLRGYAAGAAPTSIELPGVTNYGQLLLSANTPTEVLLTSPIALQSAGGYGFCISSSAVNTQLILYADLEENVL